jgi:hypothetical protein
MKRSIVKAWRAINRVVGKHDPIRHERFGSRPNHWSWMKVCDDAPDDLTFSGDVCVTQLKEIRDDCNQ